ncbi:hypothetical protein GIB67_026308 [Kingdonia uniflora]|uniref:Nuclear nucleic acid-binding protein C1D n=1 Tax=Kingdonia uniflora TaxID=39325 RepID=A0A7J7N622_9MAGN|nr:hypothetical protein GIB67_026308 [Kingdonia uniflora]
MVRSNRVDIGLVSGVLPGRERMDRLHREDAVLLLLPSKDVLGRMGAKRNRGNNLGDIRVEDGQDKLCVSSATVRMNKVRHSGSESGERLRPRRTPKTDTRDPSSNQRLALSPLPMCQHSSGHILLRAWIIYFQILESGGWALERIGEVLGVYFAFILLEARIKLDSERCSLMPKNIEDQVVKGVIPERVMEAVKRSLVNIEDLKTNLLQFLAIAEPDVLAEMPPIRRAHALFLVAKATSMLFSLRLRCQGVSPDNHPVKTELERLSLYEEKLERYMYMSREQRQSMRNISKGEAVRSRDSEHRNAKKKRKHQSSEKQSVRAAAQEFLEKATQELLGNNKGDLKGPLRMDVCDEEDFQMNVSV